MNPFRDSTDILHDRASLARRLSHDGYLFFPRLIPPDYVCKLRQSMLKILDNAGWIDTGSGYDLESAIGNSKSFVPDTDPAATAVMIQQMALPSVRDLQHHSMLISLFERIFDEPVFPLPRVIPRTLFPNQDDHTTPPHQDYPHVQGSKRSCAAWIPLGDCGPDMGGLAIARSSNNDGVLPIVPAMGAGGLGVSDQYQGRWHYTPFLTGDVMIFNCLTVHKGIPNRSKKLRLSIDMRYQPVSEPVCEDWLQPHRNAISWEDLYKDWPDKRTQYYWRALHLQAVPFDKSYYEQREQTALDMAACGDRNALAALRRIKATTDDKDLCRRASAAIENLDSVR